MGLIHAAVSRWLADVSGDLRYALRAMRRNPGFAFVATLMIALGTGGTTALFSFADAALLRPLAVRSPEHLVFIGTQGPAGARTVAPAYPDFERLREAKSLDGVAAFANDQLPIVINGQVEQVEGQVVTGNFYDVLGVKPFRGRMLTENDDAAVVIGYDYWQRRFNGRDEVLGTVVRYAGQPLTIVGVTPREFAGLQVGFPTDLTMPIIFGPADRGPAPPRWFSAVARVKPAIAHARAQSELDVVYRAGQPMSVERIQLAPAAHGAGRLRGELVGPIMLLAGLIAGVLAIACANIANLLLARGAGRRRELTVRSAIGASRARIVRQLVTESLVLFAVGSTAGVALAALLVDGLRDFLAVGRIPIRLDVVVDARATVFTASLCLFTALLAGLAPALRASKVDAAELRVRRGASSHRLSRWLVTLQVAATIVILVNGSLLVRTLSGLRSAPRGFQLGNVLTLSVQPLSASGAERRDRIWPGILQRVGRLPGVDAASLSVLTPLSGRDRSFRIDVAGFDARADADRVVRLNYVSANYFATFGIPVLRGRAFGATERVGGPPAAIVNESTARFYFRGRDALVGRVGVGAGSDSARAIVGVVADTKHKSLREDVHRFVYLPLAQALEQPTRLSLAVRTQGDPLQLVGAIRREILAVDPSILVSDVLTMDRQMDQSLLRERLVSGLSMALAALGLVLAAVGLYGLASYAVVRRTGEFGLRMALGATPGSVRRLVLWDAGSMIGVGIVVGLPASLVASRAFRSLLYGVSPADPLTIAACLAILGAVVGLAAYLPARRASRIEPAVALSAE